MDSLLAAGRSEEGNVSRGHYSVEPRYPVEHRYPVETRSYIATQHSLETLTGDTQRMMSHK